MARVSALTSFCSVSVRAENKLSRSSPREASKRPSLSFSSSLSVAMTSIFSFALGRTSLTSLCTSGGARVEKILSMSASTPPAKSGSLSSASASAASSLLSESPFFLRRSFTSSCASAGAKLEKILSISESTPPSNSAPEDSTSSSVVSPSETGVSESAVLSARALTSCWASGGARVVKMLSMSSSTPPAKSGSLASSSSSSSSA
ncbi:MAG: hypothetical protein BWY75_03388 [bacterium ADurb.Bin425]|nr:MAG: hypothetical protein BWY75_03388 [bacterium ADurb.Bin425]